MKKILVGVLLTTFSLVSFSGTIKNRSNSDEITIRLVENSQKLEVTGSVMDTKVMPLKDVKADSSSIQLLAANNWVTDEILDQETGMVVASIVLPPINAIRVVSTTYDLITFPVKAPLKLFRNMRNKKDFKLLNEAITSEKVLIVSSSRFNRIASLLSYKTINREKEKQVRPGSRWSYPVN